MDIEKLIESAEYCKEAMIPPASKNSKSCCQCPAYENNIHDCLLHNNRFTEHIIILAMRDYHEALIKAERAAVIAEVREWAEIESEWIQNNGWYVNPRELNYKLDSMADKGEK